MKFALIKDNIVRNIIVADYDFIDSHFNDLNCDLTVRVCGMYVDIGFSYIDGEFSPPSEE